MMLRNVVARANRIELRATGIKNPPLKVLLLPGHGLHLLDMPLVVAQIGVIGE
jgi:hypothetical protein